MYPSTFYNLFDIVVWAYLAFWILPMVITPVTWVWKISKWHSSGFMKISNISRVTKTKFFCSERVLVSHKNCGNGCFLSRLTLFRFFTKIGGASVTYQMLNKDSRKYFQRAMSISSTALNYYTLYEPNHLERMQKYSNKQSTDELVEYLKTTDTDTLAKCETTNDFGPILLHSFWVPTIEDPETKGAFITKHPEEIYQSDDVPAMDILFSFNSEVFICIEFWTKLMERHLSTH